MDHYTSSPVPEALRATVAEVMLIDDIEMVRRGDFESPRFLGRLKVEAQTAYDQISPRLRAMGLLGLLQQEGDRVALLVLPALAPPNPSRLWLALLLFALTIASTFYVGGQDVDWATGAIAFNVGHGLAFSASLLGILLAHELGHYLMARREGVAVSYPFFIPMPLFLLGTMGAFISIKEPVPNRRALLGIAIAGPLAGLVVAIPVLMIGLALSEVRNLAEMQAQLPDMIFFTEGNSLLYAGLKLLVFGRFLPDGGYDVFMHPVALAGWAGLLVTGLNLLPAGQLDGGHIFFALFGPKAAQIMSMLVAVVLLALGFLWSGWFLWAVIVALLGQNRSPLLNEVTPLQGSWRLLALLGLVVFALVFTPMPITDVIMP
ncbi:site-2 protease family protein [Candidatus Chloroploca sp. M-50]|uniref:Site-2 protease family protein n=1 Tax=Candidatus Chloroploca mongolica TaxID=2528176 RepID=A0ABS4DBT8_9CHLR|nr:site-2 protease family protein [Candidatus Chloroploca mongolica]MBP1466917.1 site-2 protease family protein [Candidatus Chloroploca mongolica]